MKKLENQNLRICQEFAITFRYAADWVDLSVISMSRCRC